MEVFKPSIHFPLFSPHFSLHPNIASLLSSLMTLTPKILGGYSGAMVETMGYPAFFTFTALIGIPVLLLIYMVDKHVMSQDATRGDNITHE